MRPRGGAVFLLFSGAGAVPPLFLLGGGLFDAPFRLFEQRESFSCSSFFLITARSELFVSPLVRISYSPLSYSERRTNFLCLAFRSAAGDIWCFVLPLLFGEGRSVFRRRRKGVGVFGEKRELPRSETNLKNKVLSSVALNSIIHPIPSPRARMSGRAAPPSERAARGCLPAPQIRCARKREDRCRVLKYWRAFPPSRR